jgi:multidrug transporter EmrE-like cation transporter
LQFFFAVIFFNIIALKNGVRVKDMPILESLGYVSVPVFSYFFLSEKYTKRDMASLGLIIIGIVVFYL